MKFDPKALMELARRRGEGRAFVQWVCAAAGVIHTPPDAMRFLVRHAKFCRWGTSCFHPDPRIHAMLEGRREAFQQIIDYLQLNPEQLARLHGAQLDPEELDA